MRTRLLMVALSVSMFGWSSLGWSVGSGHATAQENGQVNAPVTIDVFGAGDLEVPEAFKSVPVKSSMIEHEFQASAGEGDQAQTARVTMMAAGGDVKANIVRWKGQFPGGDEAAEKVEMMKLGNWEVHLVDLNGTFSETMGGGPFSGGKVVKRPDYAMTGAILVHPEGRKYFVKMIGPKEVVKANRDAFVKMIKSIQ